MTLRDPAAKAWRLVVSGTGARAADRWEILVETGDVQPLITAREVRGGDVVDVMDLTGFSVGTAAAGGCHSTCSGSAWTPTGSRSPPMATARYPSALTLPGRRCR